MLIRVQWDRIIRKKLQQITVQQISGNKAKAYNSAQIYTGHGNDPTKLFTPEWFDIKIIRLKPGIIGKLNCATYCCYYVSPPP